MTWEELYVVVMSTAAGLVVEWRYWRQAAITLWGRMRTRRSAMTGPNRETSCETNNYEEEGRRMREPASAEAVES
ncbi:hypothetical protein [Nocardia panacis]|uniref:hypothetical protein n=1 Tax=Nocardia panacis TaxID=2340916 RepID=UPI0011C435D9|nr:hypothetical protein [Nocardia panacis]